MLKHRWVAFLFCVFVGVLFTTTAKAEVPERAFSSKTDKDGAVVEVGKNTSVNQIVDAFQAMYTRATGKPLTWRIIQAANPTTTFPACAVPKDGHMWRGKGDTSVWTDCPEDKQWVALAYGPSGRIRIPMTSVETYHETQERLALQDKCFKDAACLAEQIKRLGGTVPVASAPVPTPPPVAAPAAPTPLATAAPVPAPDAPSSATTVKFVTHEVIPEWLLNYAVRMTLLAGVYGILCIFYIIRKWALQAQIETMQKMLKVSNGLVDSLKAELKQTREAAGAALVKFEEEVNKFTATIAALTRGKTDLEKTNDTLYRRLVTRAQKFGPVGITTTILDLDLFVQQQQMVEADKAIAAVRATLSKMHDDIKRCAILYQTLSVNDQRRIELDNEITELKQSVAAFKAKHKGLVDLGDTRAESYDRLIREEEAHLAALEAECIKAAGKCAAERPEFEELHEKLTGFKLSTDLLYAEAQRDRNHAATALGAAMGKAKANEVTERRIQQQIDLLTAERTELKQGQQALLVDRATVDTHLEQVRRLTANLALALGRSPKMSIQELVDLDGPTGMVREAELRLGEAAEQIERLSKDNRSLVDDLRMAQEDLPALREELQQTGDLKAAAEREAREAQASQEVLAKECEELRAANSAFDDRVRSLQGDNARLTKTVRELETRPSNDIGHISLRNSHLPADLMAAVSDEGEAPMTPPERSHLRAVRPDEGRDAMFESLFMAMEAVADLPADVALEVSKQSQLWAVFALLKRRIRINFAGVCTDEVGTDMVAHGRMQMLANESKFQHKLDVLKVGGIGWFVNEFQPPAPSRSKRTMAPTGFFQP